LMARNGQGDARSRTEEIEQYRRAAEETLNQLDWCVDYLHGVRKNGIAQVIQKNVAHIRRQMKTT
jgi:hypothetical protein